ncbi:CDP-alcohol phosphatidyltransferase family protein [Candidatus Bathyarchaeota archaeon]|nr:CDP-alcohol phosphatidyltransferase family protein [Candidatus Bathyarchaeota archaeon]
MPQEWDGIVSRHINRKLSRPIARFLAKYPSITPNHATIISFAVSLTSAFSFPLLHPAIGGILAQLASILDGVDGDLAVITNRTSAFGGFLDTMLDRYSDVAILAGMIWYMLIIDGWNPTKTLVGILALAGSLLVSYSRARAKSDLGIVFRVGVSGYAANRDVRLFIIMIGGILNQIFWTLLAIAILTNFTVFVRMWNVWRTLKGRADVDDAGNS